MTNEVGKVSFKATAEQIKKQQELKEAQSVKPEDIEVGKELKGVQESSEDIKLKEEEKKQSDIISDMEVMASIPEEIEQQTNNILSEMFANANKDFEAQLKNDGWTGDVADAFSKIWNNEIYGNKHGNTAKLVRKDLSTFKKNIEALNEAAQKGEKEYSKVFKKIFKIDYDPAKIESFKKTEQTFKEATGAKNLEEAVSKQLSLLLKNDKLSEEFKTMNAGVAGNTVTYTTATKQDVYEREYKKLTDIIGKESQKQLDEKLKDVKNLDEKYKILHNVAKSLEKSLQENTKAKCGGKEYSEIKENYDNSFKDAFGTENNIVKRVSDYNISQQKGAGMVQSATVMAAVTATMLSMGTATPFTTAMLAAAGTATLSTVAVNVSDRMTSGLALDELKNKGVNEWLVKSGEITDWKQVAKASVTSGAMTIAFMGQSYAVTNLCSLAGMGAIGTTVVNSAAFIGTGLGTEKLMTGEISVEGATFTVLLAVVGGAIQVVKIRQAIATQAEAKLGTDITNARKTLGFDNEQQLTLEQVDKQWKTLSRKAHPDAGGSNTQMALINSAHDVLKNNILRINDFVGKSIQPAVTPQQQTKTESKIDQNKATAQQTSVEQFTKELRSLRTPSGEIVLSDIDINNIIQNAPTSGSMANYQAQIRAVLANPEELNHIIMFAKPGQRAVDVVKATHEPLASTIEANPKLFKTQSTTLTSPSQVQQKPHSVENLLGKMKNVLTDLGRYAPGMPDEIKLRLQTMKLTESQYALVEGVLDNAPILLIDPAFANDFFGFAIYNWKTPEIVNPKITLLKGIKENCKNLFYEPKVSRSLCGALNLCETEAQAQSKIALLKTVGENCPQVFGNNETLRSLDNVLRRCSTPEQAEGITTLLKGIKETRPELFENTQFVKNELFDKMNSCHNKSDAQNIVKSLEPKVQEITIVSESNGVTKYSDGTFMTVQEKGEGYKTTTITKADGTVETCETYTGSDGLESILSGSQGFMKTLLKYSEAKPAVIPKQSSEITIISESNGVTKYSDGTVITKKITNEDHMVTTIKKADGTVETGETYIGSDGLVSILSGSKGFIKTLLKYSDAKPIKPVITSLTDKNGILTEIQTNPDGSRIESV